MFKKCTCLNENVIKTKLFCFQIGKYCLSTKKSFFFFAFAANLIITLLVPIALFQLFITQSA